MKENNENKIKNQEQISKLIKAFPKDIAALDKRSVFAFGQIPRLPRREIQLMAKIID